MKSVKLGMVGILAGCAALSVTGAAFAQDAAAQAQVGAGAAATTTTTTVAPAPAPATAPPAPPTQAGMALPGAAPAAPPPGGRDHDLVTGHFGIGYMGRRTVQIATPNGNGVTGTPVDAPIIGMRYWLDPMLGIDAGIGFLFTGGSNSVNGTSADRQGYTAFLIHGGVPLALAGSQHFSFQIVPELNFGYAASTINGNPNTDLSGIHFDIGARAGAEVQFGFIGIPELSLQAGVGLAYSLDHVKASAGNNSASSNQSAFGTNTGDNPWNIFTGNIAALYYFD